MTRLIAVLASVCGAFVYALDDRHRAAAGVGFWDLAIELSANTPFIVYVLLPTVLLCASFETRRVSRYWFMLRLGSVSGALAEIAKAALQVTAMILLGMTAGTLLAAWGAPLRASAPPGSVSAAFRDLGVPPVAAYLEGLAVIAALIMTSTVLVAACGLVLRPIFAFVLSLVAWAWVLASIQFGGRAGVVVESFLTPLDGNAGVGGWGDRLLACAALMGIAVVAVALRDRALPWGTRPRPSPAMAVIALGGVIVGGSVLAQPSDCGNAAACLAQMFPGSEGSLLHILAWLSVPVLALLAAMLHAQSIHDGMLPVSLIRYGSAGREFSAAVRRGASMLSLAYALWGVCGITVLSVRETIPAGAGEWLRVIVAVVLQPLLASLGSVILFLMLSRRASLQVATLVTLAASITALLAAPVEIWALAGLSGGRFAYGDVREQLEALGVLVLFCVVLFTGSLITLSARTPGFRKDAHAHHHLHSRVESVSQTPALRGRRSRTGPG